MKIGFVVNSIGTETAHYTTTRLSMAAVNRGHEVWTMSVADFAYGPDGQVHARARGVSRPKYKSTDTFLAELKSDKARQERILVDELDVLMLRNDPSEESSREWARRAGVMFGRMATKSGVIVLNDPSGLLKAENKQYLEHFPE